ncbi:MAG: glutamate synthase, partial [Candidatus Thiodiazotropha sp. (ex Ustalcina ferruginea)]|nr:glutamate synthase [Candidatus Thiodiazotropha sp. (ex Ustalcina ferruginea)]
ATTDTCPGPTPTGVYQPAHSLSMAGSVGVDYIILDGRGGGTGAAPLIFRDNISVPTIPALARARRYLDKKMALGADAIAVSNSALQSIGCLGMRACHTNNCPVGIATQKPDLRRRLKIGKGASQLNNFFCASTELMQVMARACGHDHLNKFCVDDLTTFDSEMAHLTGVAYAGVSLD